MSRIMTTLIKQRKEAAEQFEKGNRQDLATKERQEITIIEAYLPPPSPPRGGTGRGGRGQRIRRIVFEGHGSGNESRDGPLGRPIRRRQSCQ